MTVHRYRELYEGLTQQDPSFRERLYAYAKTDLAGPILSEQELSENRQIHAMLGIHPIYRREVELSGIADYEKRAFRLFAPDGETSLSFSDLDPAYVSFLESQRRVYNVKQMLPFSSVALKMSREWLAEDNVRAPELPDTYMHVPKAPFSLSRRVLEQAFAKNMVMVNHLQEEIEKHGLDSVYNVNRDDLITYCQSHSFDYQFDRSVGELKDLAYEAADADGLGI